MTARGTIEDDNIIATFLSDLERRTIMGSALRPTLLSIARFAIRKRDQSEACRWLREGLERAVPRFSRDHHITRAFNKLIASWGCDGPASVAHHNDHE